MLLLTVALALLICVFLWKRRRFYYASLRMKGPISLPIVGNFLQIQGSLDDLVDKMTKIAETYDSPIRFWLGPKFVVCTIDPSDFENILNSPNTLDKDEIYDLAQPIAGQGIFTCKDLSRWRRNRKLIAATLNQRTLNSFVPIFEEQSLILCDKLKTMENKGVFDVHLSLYRCHLDIICSKCRGNSANLWDFDIFLFYIETAMGVKVNAQFGQSEYFDWIIRLSEFVTLITFKFWCFPSFIFDRMKEGREFKKLSNSVKSFNQNIIQRKRKSFEKSSGNEEDSEKNKVFLDYLIEIGTLSDDELLDEVSTFIAAGSDTAALTEGFILMMLGMHQDVQNQVYEEQQRIFGNTHHPITCDHLNEMIYLERVIKETMRLFPVGAILVRKFNNDFKIGNYTVPEGTSCYLGILFSHRSKKFWKDPLKFDPDRFLPEEIAKRHPYSWLPFSVGPRNCVGLKFGMMVMKVVISTVVRKYQIFCGYKRVEEIRLRIDMLLTATDGFNISLESRH